MVVRGTAVPREVTRCAALETEVISTPTLVRGVTATAVEIAAQGVPLTLEGWRAAWRVC